jgi:hypothetical protein
VIRLKIPTVLRSATDAARVIEVEGATVCDALTAAIELHPHLEARLFDEHGQLRRFLKFVDEEDIRFEKGLDTPAVGRPDGLASPGGGRRIEVCVEVG